jgi:hypothetical protein
MSGEELQFSTPTFSVETRVVRLTLIIKFCINAVSSSTINGLCLKSVLHPNPYSASWVDMSSKCDKEMSCPYSVS